jgi:hypothetical protein
VLHDFVERNEKGLTLDIEESLVAEIAKANSVVDSKHPGGLTRQMRDG